MQRTEVVFSLSEGETFKKKILNWAQQYDEIAWLDSNAYRHLYYSFDGVLAVDALTSIKTDYHRAFDDLKEYRQATDDWIFGYLAYDLKNDVEKLQSDNSDGLGFADLYFFQPKKLVFIEGDKLRFSYMPMVDDEIETDFKSICEWILPERSSPSLGKGKIKARISEEVYQNKINRLLEHIYRGDVYEVNFCQEFYADGVAIDPCDVFLRLNAISHPPFACYLKLENHYVLSASPERYLKREGNTVITQPIKGTSRRSPIPEEDAALRDRLESNPKERSENIMIVDLVRNDLSITAKKGSVKVEELCGVYTFQQVHQLISTVVSEVEDSTDSIDVIRTTFPMGSMTGAPKISSMELIESLEESKRGVYSGAVGYFSPSGDFDFNVIIRSILYNASNNYLSFTVGGAITAASDATEEYEECLVKAEAMRKVLEE